jgi:hypothetical protein
MASSNQPQPAPHRPDAEDRLDEDTVRVLSERRENPGPLRPWNEEFERMKKSRRSEPQPPR